MFTTHFKMKIQPFCESISAQQILQDERMTQGLARLQYMASQGTIALITGQTGVGKSTLIKLFLSNLPQKQYQPVYVHFSHVRASSLLKLIVTELGEVPKQTKERVFLQIIDKTQKANLTTVLIIDEGHLLDSDAITDLRLLVSSALQEAPPLKIILSGQEGLKNKLKRSSHTDFAQRISVHCPLKALSKTQTVAYIDYQMKYAGASEKIFEPEVKEMIHDYSSGIPRQINNIATGCLINASIQKAQKINLELLNQTMAEFQLF
jgi:general secretion pathway protein A